MKIYTDKTMLQIKISGETLDLPTGVLFEYKIENPLFKDDVIPAPSTYTFNIPATERNNKILRYPQHINQKSKWGEFDSEILFGTIVVARGVIVLRRISEAGDYSVFFKGVGVEDLLDTPLCDLPLKEYHFSEDDRLAEVHRLIESSFKGEEPFTLPMVRKGVPDEGNMLQFKGPQEDDGKFHRVEHSGDYNYRRNTLTGDAPGKGKYRNSNVFLGYLNSFNIYPQTLPAGQKYYNMGGFTDRSGKPVFYNVLAPFPYLWHILDVVLLSLGIKENPFKKEGELKDIIVSGAFALVLRVEGLRKLQINRGLPDFNAGAFLKEIFKASGYLLNRLNGSQGLLRIDEVLSRKPSADWSDILLEGYTIEEEKEHDVQVGIKDSGVVFPEERTDRYECISVESPYFLSYYADRVMKSLDVEGRKYSPEDLNELCWYVKSSREFFFSHLKGDKCFFEYKGIWVEGTPFPHFAYSRYRSDSDNTKSNTSERQKNNGRKRDRRGDIAVPSMCIDVAVDGFSPDFSKPKSEGRYSGELKDTIRMSYMPIVYSGEGDKRKKPQLLYYTGMQEAYIVQDKTQEFNQDTYPKYPAAATSYKNNAFVKLGERSKKQKKFYAAPKLKLKGQILVDEKFLRSLTGVEVVSCLGKKWVLKEIVAPLNLESIGPAKITLIELPVLD